MKNIRRIKAQVVDARPLSQDDKDLLEEIKSLRIASLKNLTDAFRQIITLSTAIIGLQAAILKLPHNPAFQTWGIQKVLMIISLMLLFSATLVASIGQISNRIDVSTLNILKLYQQQRDILIRRGQQLYVVANAFYILGLALFIVNFVLFIAN